MRHAAYGDGRFGDQGLNAAGRAQAVALRDRLGTLRFERLWSSPLRRARETAEILGAGLGLEPRVHACLAEGDHGELAGLDPRAARARWPGDFSRGHSVVARLAASGRTAPGGETREAFLARASEACGLVRAALGESGLTLVVSHGGLLNYALQMLAGMPTRDEVPFGFDHCGVVRVLAYGESPAFGPFPMLRFGPGGEAGDAGPGAAF